MFSGQFQKTLLLSFFLVPSAMGVTKAARAASGDRIGDAVTITNTVMADFEKKRRKLASGDDVRQDDTIEVNADAEGELKLDDDTKIALAGGARLVLDKFVYDSDKKAGTIVLNLVKGAFRFITGVAAKPAYVINTPNASITVRGTVFDLYILRDGSVWLLLHEGGIEVTDSRNVCHVLDQPGRLIRVTSNGRVGSPANWSSLPGNSAVPFDTAFPFVVKAPQVDPNPVLTRDSIINATLSDEPEKTCVNPHEPVKIKKASDDSDRDEKPKKKKARHHDEGSGDAPKRSKSAKRDDNGPPLDIGISIGIGKFGHKHHDDMGGDRPRRGGGMFKPE
jgi:hypothetical protein